ncbi:MAG: NAD-dependent epimerase/dehydratase family protein [Myxococcales bacterium]|nr:NAD-dependent epimerase/dehydratase family protein [Myxococcales bacterium]
MRAFVTGSTGFIGRHLVERLIKLGDEVTCLVRPTADVGSLEAMGVKLRLGDVTDPHSFADLCANVDVVYHLAGVIRASDTTEMWRVNEGGVARVIDACAAATTPPIFVLMSSLAAAGPSDAEIPLVEDDAPAPISEYGRSKLAGERAARARAGRVPVTIVRPPVVFGEYDRETFELFRLADKGWHVVPGMRQQRLSLVHAADLAHLTVEAGERGERVPGPGIEAPAGVGVYYAGDDQRPTFHDLGQLLGEALGREVRVVNPPQALSWGLAAVAELAARVRGKPTLLTLDKMREATAGSWMCSSRKAREQFGLKMRMSLTQRLTQTAEWYREAGWLE